MSDYKKTVIVDSMNDQEILDLLQKDIVFLQHKIDENIKAYRKLAYSSIGNERVYYKPLRYKSARGFNYVIQFFKRNAADLEKDKEKLGILYYVWYIKNHGVYAIMFSKASAWGRVINRFTIFTPHFFDRYRERCLKDNSINKPDVVHSYIMNNQKVILTGHPSTKYPNSFWILCNDGLCLCKVFSGFNLVAKTFVSFDMSGSERKDFIEKAIEVKNYYGFEMSLPDEDFEEYDKDDVFEE